MKDILSVWRIRAEVICFVNRLSREVLNLKSWMTHKSKIEIVKLMDMRCNCFLIRKDGITVLVDTSIRAEGSILLRRLKELNVVKLHCILLTHVHFDHTGNVRRLQKKYNCPVFVHSSEEDFLKEGFTYLPKGSMVLTKFATTLAGNRVLRFQRFPACHDKIVTELSYNLPVEPNDVLTPADADPALEQVEPALEQADTALAPADAALEQADSALASPDDALTRVDQILTRVGIQILYTPGHTVGSVSYIVDDEAALVGDTMINPFRMELRPPFADLPDRLPASWKVLLDTHCRYFLPAHGGVVGRELLEEHNAKARLWRVQ